MPREFALLIPQTLNGPRFLYYDETIGIWIPPPPVARFGEAQLPYLLGRDLSREDREDFSGEGLSGEDLTSGRGKPLAPSE